jgi:AbrB family looped-hinge helix DNA binding protein
MKSTIILGKARRLVLPKELCQRLHLNEGDSLELEVDGDGFRLRPSADEGVSLVREGELLVATGYPKGVDIGAAVIADRDDREANVAAPYQRTRGTRNK